LKRFFGYLEHRTGRFCDNINTCSIKSIEDYATAIIRNILTILKTHGGVLLG
jgi:hypothetical protein